MFIIRFQKIHIVDHVEEGLKVGKYQVVCNVDYHLAFSVWSLHFESFDFLVIFI